MSLRNIEDMKKQAIDQLSTQIEKAYKCGCKDGKRQSQELIEHAYQRGYDAGYSKAENDYHAKTEDDRQSSYELGLNTAWEAAKAIAEDCLSESRMTMTLFDFNYAYPVFENVSAAEAIEKLHAYERLKKREENSEIRVGDEVYLVDKHDPLVVTDNEGDSCVTISQFGKWAVIQKKDLHKTNRHFLEIAEVLKKMQEGK